MKKIEKEIIYTKDEVINYQKKTIAKLHKQFDKENQNYGIYHQTFKEWKKDNPNHYLAKMYYPEEEYVEIISFYIKYFNSIAAVKPTIKLPI